MLAISRYGHGCAVLEDSLYISGGYTGEVDKRRANWQIKALAETLLTNEEVIQTSHWQQAQALLSMP